MKEKYGLAKLEFDGSGLLKKEENIIKEGKLNQNELYKIQNIIEELNKNKRIIYRVFIKQIPENEDDKAVLEYYKKIDEEMIEELNKRNKYI